ncbi:MAG: antitoxin [Thiobacillus sp.]
MKTAKLFEYGRCQAVRLPAEFRFEGEEVLIRRDPSTGDVILSPRKRKFSDWIKLRDRLLPRVPKDELKVLDNLRDASLMDECADAVRAKLAELDLSERDISDAIAAIRKPAG